ncbi:murein biosynthesis integral membrane protein MurJ [Patescibacteria group bacterium]
MFKSVIKKGKQAILAPQNSILSAATLIMVMIIAAKALGFVRQRVLFSYFDPTETDLFLAAFEMPDLFFEVFIFSVISAAFIPVFSNYLSKGKEKTAWRVARNEITILFTVFTLISIFIFVFARPLYEVIAGDSFKSSLGIDGGFSGYQIDTIVTLSRIILLAQLFFVFSSFMTGISESYKRFLGPSIAPLMYNLGIILGIVLFAEKYGLVAPAVGAVVGAFMHLAVQIPAVTHTGFRYRFVWDTKHPGVRKFFQLAFPRMIELGFMQLRRFSWLFLGSVFAGGFTYLKSADLLQALPVGVFGVSLSKAALPTLSRFSGKADLPKFRNTLVTTLNQIFFLVVPVSVFMIVLRVPLVRLVFGAAQFDWPSTLETGYALTAFSIGIFAYSANLLITRAFYALQNTKTPVIISIVFMILNTIVAFTLVLGLGWGIWSVALSYALAGIVQMLVLLRLILKRTKTAHSKVIVPFSKIAISSLASGFVMFTLIKIFDKSVWVKRLSFLGRIEQTKSFPFEVFVIDTRYTLNLFALTIFVGIVGVILYIILMILMRSEELWSFVGYAKRIAAKRKFEPIPTEKPEQMTPPPVDPEG